MRNLEKLLSQKTIFEKHLNSKLYQLSPYHFSSIFLWQDFFDFEFEIVEDSLCIFAQQEGACFLYLPPLTPTIKVSVLEYCFLKMNKINPRVARIENVQQSQLLFFENLFKVQTKSSEYVYRKEDLIDLKGQDYKSQRHDIHRFQSQCQSLFRPYEDKDFKQCLSLYESWAQNRHDKHTDQVYRQMLSENKIVHELALNFHKALGLVGYIVEVDKKIVAYSFGYSLNTEIFCVLLEIADVKISGVNAFIFNRVCSDEKFKEHALINTMDDFGLPFVAASKQAYHPVEKPVSYIITQIQ